MAKKLGGLGKGLNAIFIENDSEDNNGSITLKIQPLLVRPLPLGGYQIVAGERRYRACRMAGITEVPVIIRELGDTETMEIALIENLQREDLTPIEEALGYKVLNDERGFSQDGGAQ